MTRLTKRTLLLAAAASALAAAAPAVAQDKPIKVISFRSITTAPIFAAEKNGFFAKQKVSIELIFTRTSDQLRNGVADGTYQIAHAAVDNAVNQVENQKHDVVVVIGGDGGLNQLFVQPEIKSIEDLKGKTVVVDSASTAFALLLYKMLKSKGINKGDYVVKPVGGTPQRLKALLDDKTNAGGLLSPPFSVSAETSGKLKNLGSPMAVVGPYQSGSAWVLRSWGKANEDLLVRYLKAYIQGSRWVRDPANKAAVVSLLQERLKLEPAVAARSYEMAMDEKGGGWAKDAAFDIEGFKSTLGLRAEMQGTWGGKPPAPDKFIDTSYYKKALAGL
jgi:ABC-type nitrate/sulfonate/bicarbonate transport system substrate-binding protein